MFIYKLTTSLPFKINLWFKKFLLITDEMGILSSVDSSSSKTLSFETEHGNFTTIVY